MGSQVDHGNGGIHRRVRFLLLELLSINMCVNTYASARRTHGSKCIKGNLSKTCCANYGTPANISEPSFQHALVFLIKKKQQFYGRTFVSIPTVSNCGSTQEDYNFHARVTPVCPSFQVAIAIINCPSLVQPRPRNTGSWVYLLLERGNPALLLKT